MRCVSMCPRHAIKSILTYKGNTYSAVKANDFVKNKTDRLGMNRSQNWKKGSNIDKNLIYNLI